MREYDINQKPDETLLKYYRRLAKAADERLDRLEDYSEQVGFKVATKWAYQRATKDIAKWNKLLDPKVSRVKKLRFNTAPPGGEEDLLAKISDIKTFLSSPTSTKTGIIEVFKKKADTMNVLYKGNFTWQQLAKYYDKGYNTAWESKFGSQTAVTVLGVIQKNADKVAKSISKTDISDWRIEDELIETKVKQALRQGNKLHIKELISK